MECRTFQYEQVKDEEGNLLYEEDGDPLVERVDLEEPAYYYTTKGDANDVVDGSAVYYKNVIGTPIFSAPYLGYFSSWLQTRKGTIISICALLILLILTFLPDVLRMVDDDPPAQKPEKKKKAAAKTRKQPADASAQPQRKKRPLTQEEREMIIAGRKERGEELRGPLTQEERELIIAKRKQEARERRLSAASAEASVQTPDQTGDTAQQVRRRRRRTDSSDGEN